MQWKLPPTVNGVLKNFLIDIQELDLEISIYFDFNTEKTSDSISVKNISDPNNYILYYSANSIYIKQSSFSLTLIDLEPFTYYSILLSSCNNLACTSSSKNFDFEENKYVKLITNEYNLFELADPVIFVVDETSLEIVWQEPRIVNGHLKSFKLYRNNLFLIEFDLRKKSKNINLNYERGFYSYIEEDLIPDTLYSYRVMVSNSNFSILSKEVFIETPSTGFIKQCNVSEVNTDFKLENTASISILRLLNLVNFQFIVKSPNEIMVEYNIVEWKKLITCISLFNYNNMNYVSTDESGPYDEKTAFTIKILLLSNINGLQSIDFPYPDDLSLNKSISYTISGLLANTNYSIHIAFSSFYPSKQLLTTHPIFMQTFEDVPCCELKKPLVIQNPFKRKFSIRFSPPYHPNGYINKFRLTRAKLSGSGCLFFVHGFNSSDIEQIKEINLTSYSKQFLFDSTNSDFIYKDLDEELNYKLAYYAYKITVYNTAGYLESDWSLPVLNQHSIPPEVPQDPKINRFILILITFLSFLIKLYFF